MNRRINGDGTHIEELGRHPEVSPSREQVTFVIQDSHGHEPGHVLLSQVSFLDEEAEQPIVYGMKGTHPLEEGGPYLLPGTGEGVGIAIGQGVGEEPHGLQLQLMMIL